MCHIGPAPQAKVTWASLCNSKPYPAGKKPCRDSLFFRLVGLENIMVRVLTAVSVPAKFPHVLSIIALICRRVISLG